MTSVTPLPPIERILVAGAPAGGLGTIEAGFQLAVRLGARVRVLQVEPQHRILERLGVVQRPAAEVADADIVRLARRAGLEASTLEIETLRGQARRLLLDEAASWRADLVVLGIAAPGRRDRNAAGVRLGTVADHLIRHLGCPILLVDDRRPVLPSRVLFPVDLSELSRTAMACGLGFLRQLGLDGPGCGGPGCGGREPGGEEIERFALFVVPTPGDLTDDQRRSIDRAGKAEVVSWLAELPAAAGVRPLVAMGPPAGVIGERAARGADLVVMGTHGYGSQGTARRGVGSVTGEVLAAGPCSMLIVPPVAELAAEIAEEIVSGTAPRFGEQPSR